MRSLDANLVRCLTQALLRHQHPEWQIGDWYRQVTHTWHWPRCLPVMRRAVALVGPLRRTDADLGCLARQLTKL